MSRAFETREYCPVCHSPKQKILLRIPFNDPRIMDFIESYYSGGIDQSILNDELFEIIFCKTCSLLYQKNVLNETFSFQLYENWISASDSLQKKQQASVKLFNHYAKQAESVSELIGKNPNEIDILEYGMGWGYCLRVMNAFNYNVTGYELSEKRADHASSLGLNVTDNLNYPESSFDFIYANQVFEHLTNPREILLILSRLLKPNGVLHINVPQGIHMRFLVKRKTWKAKKDACHPLEHINCFNRKSLTYLGTQVSTSLDKLGYSLKACYAQTPTASIARYLYDRTISTNVYFRKSL